MQNLNTTLTTQSTTKLSEPDGPHIARGRGAREEGKLEERKERMKQKSRYICKCFKIVYLNLF